ncbi:M20 metallopeptidase family protein [Oceanobacillus halophilus]|uniref:Amidohydrolase n=1 Tax=Oceanobacillus halophilus TaxID=930130 RepID=A0A494ZQU5_9BACI|nr:amidohydrolase [Oceanobacillus halophilus]RKQ27983.1 amidohydrolase [Oceanobacillus halophilus]
MSEVKDFSSIFDEIDEQFSDVQNWRRYLHKHPELSFEEKNTAIFIEEKLKSFGLPVKTQIGGHGMVAELEGKMPGKTIAFRADFDALPIHEENDTPYASVNAGVMHACGHDGHTAALLGTAQLLSKYKEQLKGKILFVFQPAEEKPPGGAKYMIEEGILDEVDYVFGAHLASEIPLGQVAVGAGYQMAAVDKFEITVKGHGGHGARPNESIDPIVIGSEIVQSLQKIVSRRVDPLKSAVVTLGVFQAGAAFNVIPDEAKIEGTVRTFDEDVRDLVENEIHSIVKGIISANNAGYEMDFLRGYPSLFNHQEETATVTRIFKETFNEEEVVALEPTMGAEDFAYFLKEKPGTYFRVGSRNDSESTHYPHHHPKFDIDERALLNIEKAFIKIASHYLID